MKKKYTDIENQIRDNLVSLKKKHIGHIDFLIIESKISKWILLTLTLSILKELNIKDFSIVWYTFSKNYYNCIYNKNITNVISKFYSSEKDFEVYTNNMKFDCIIANPPYDGKAVLYCKIIDQVRKNNLKEKKDIVALMPDTWMASSSKDYYSAYDELKTKVEKVISVDSSVFDARIPQSIAIHVINNETTKDWSDYKFHLFKNPTMTKLIFEKICKFPRLWDTGFLCQEQRLSEKRYQEVINKINPEKWYFGLPRMRGGEKSTTFYTYYSEDWKPLKGRKEKCWGICKEFNTEKEAYNWRESLKSDPYIFLLLIVKLSFYLDGVYSFIPDYIDESVFTEEELGYMKVEIENFRQA